MNDANPRRHQAEGGPDDERDPYAQDPYYQQQPYGYDAYGRPLQAPPAPPPPQPGGQPYPDAYQDPYDPSPAYGGPEQGWVPQQPQPQPQPPYYGQTGWEQGARIPQQQGYDTGRQAPGYETGRQPPVYGPGQHAPAYDTGQQAPVYGTGQQPPVYDTGQQPPLYGTGQQPPVYGPGQHAPAYDTGQQAPVYGTGQQPSVYDTGQQAPLYDTGQQPPLYDTGRQSPVQDSGRQPGYRPPESVAAQAQSQAQSQAQAQAPAGTAAGAGPGPATGQGEPNYATEQFAFVDEESEESDEVIDWLKFSESRTERREEAKRRGHNRKVGLAVVLVLALLGGAGYLWHAGRLPGLSKAKTAAAAAGGAQKRDVIVVHLLPVNGGPSSTALLVDNATKGRGTTVLIPNSVQLSGDDGATTTLDKSVSDGVGPTRDALNTLLGTDIKGSWRLDSPYLELLVDSIGDVLVDTDATVKGTGKDSGKTLVPRGSQEELTGQAAVAYATYKAPGEPQTAQLTRFGQVMQAVLRKMPSDAADATRTVQGLAQILDPSLTDRQLGASLAALAELAKTGAYDTAVLPVREDGTISAQATDSVVKDVLGGAVKQTAGASAQARIEVRDATGDSKAASMAQAAILNGGSYAYVPGGKAGGTQAASQVVYGDPARLAAAKDVAATLGLPASEVAKGTVPSNADVVVVLGRDYKLPSPD